MQKSKSSALLTALILAVFFLAGLTSKAGAQVENTPVAPVPKDFPASGLVTDSLTGKKLSFINVVVGNNKDVVLTDKKGRFNFRSINEKDTLTVTSLGYEKKRVPASEFRSGRRVNVRLQPSSTMLAEVVVTKKRKPKYSKKNNPAVDLMQSIRSTYEGSDPRREKQYSYDKYEKMILSLNDFKTQNHEWLAKRLSPIEDFIDTSRYTGKPVLNVSFREKKVSRIHTADPNRRKEIVKGFRSVGIDDQLDQENIQIMLEDVLREIDIFGNDIPLMQNRFVSPLSAIGADYYKYYLGDTTRNAAGHREVELIFVPHNPQSFSFNGSLYVDLDTPDPFISKVTMRVPKALNLNFVDNIFVEQTFERDERGNRHKLTDDMSVELKILPGVQGFYVERDAEYANFSYADSPDLATYMPRDGDIFQAEGFDKRPASYWERNRFSRLRQNEEAVNDLSKRMDSNWLFRWTRRAVKLLVTGYIPTGNPSKVDIGPVNTFISANTIEGARFRLGGMTTASLSRHLFARGYTAYGTKDHRWKYSGEVEYSFVPKKRHSREFPMHSIRAEHTYDLDMIGQHYLFTNADNIFLSIKRKENNLATYRSITRLSYFYEHVCGLTLNAGIKAERQTATPWLPFINGYGDIHRHFRQSALFLDVQFAPGATFVQTSSFRLPVNMDTWIFRVTHEWGPKGLFGADFTTNKTEFSVQKRFWFSAFGYLDFMVKGGKMWSKVQYPALTWPNANLSYTIQPEAYSLMNPMEFAMDTYAAWDVTYWLNGLIFNRIPYFNMLKLREVVNFKGLWGHLSRRNNPQYDNRLYRFPIDSHAKGMGPTPYMEISAGIDNIFSILRVDYVWRLSYRHTPGAPDSGLRIALHFAF